MSTASGYILSFHWGAPGLMAFLPLALAPILLHFWRRRRTDVVYWAAFDFLADALQETRRRLRIENWLLLLLRTLLLLLLILAAADPQPGSPLPISAHNTAGRHRVFVVDISYSMDYDLGGITALERSRHLLQDIIENGRPEDTYSIVTMSGHPRAVVLEPTRNQEDVLKVVDELTTVGTAINVPATCNIVSDLLRTSDRRAVTSTIHEVVFVTDLRRAGWGANSADLEQGPSSDTSLNDTSTRDEAPQQGGPIVSALSQLSRRASVAILDVGFPRSVDESYNRLSVGDETLPGVPSNATSGVVNPTGTGSSEGEMPRDPAFLSSPSISNVAIESISMRNAPLTIGQTMRVDLSIRNWGSEPIASLPVELYVNGRQVARTTTTLPSNGTSPVVLQRRFERPGRFLLEARIPDDSLEKDNTRRLVVEVRDSLRVLIVEESGSVSGSYVAAALAPFSDDATAQGEHPAINVSRARISRWASLDSPDYDCVILCDPVQFSSGEIRLIKSRLNRGGAVVLFLGPHVNRANFNARLYDLPLSESESPLLPGRLTGPRTNTTFRIDPLDYEHPIAHPFEGNSQSGLLTTPIENYQHIELGDSPDIRSALNMGNGDPFVVTQDFQKGRLVCVTTSPSPDWASLPYWPSFLPLTHEIVRFAVLGDRSYREYVAGDVLEFTVPDKHFASVRVRIPNGDVLPMLRNTDDPSDPASLRWDETDQVGVYSMERLEEDDTEGESRMPSSPLSSSLSQSTSNDVSSSQLALLSIESSLGLLAVNPDPAEGNPARLPEESLVFPTESRIRIVKALNAADLERAAAFGPVFDFRYVRYILLLVLILSFTELYWSRRLSRN